jgi:predicted nucleic acid-binding protein
MGKKYLIDTNVVIDHFGNKLPEKGKKFLNTVEPIVFAVTQIETLGWLNATKDQLTPLYTFMEFAKILAIDEQTVEKTISLRQIKKITLGDAIIAATALVHDLTLITHNTSDFKTLTA